MYMGLATSLIVDLGLDKDVPDENSFQSFSADGLIESGRFTTAAHKAYLGCYYLCSAFVSHFLPNQTSS